MVNVTDLNPVFLWNITGIHGEDIQKIKQKLDTEDPTATFHDFQESICLFVTWLEFLNVVKAV